MEGLDWSRIRSFGSTGECSNAEDMLYLMYLAGNKPVMEYCGGTEIGGGFITGTLVQPASPATFSTPALGLDFVLLDEDGRPTDNGEVFLIPPSIGLSEELLNRDHDEVYHQGCPAGPEGEVLRRHGDQFARLGGGYFRAHGRVDDTMNLGGIKVSAAEIERVLMSIPQISECAAVAAQPAGGGPSRLVIYAVIAEQAAADPPALLQETRAKLARDLNPLFRADDVVIVKSLPRTASNKVLRRQLRDDYASRDCGD
jgi:acetyl-CoA synthetase